MADNFYASYPVEGGGGSGVTSLNSLTGALSLVGGTGISVIPSGSNITIASTATPVVPGGANTDIQFNSSGTFGGSANMTWDGTNITLSNNSAVNFTNYGSVGMGSQFGRVAINAANAVETNASSIQFTGPVGVIFGSTGSVLELVSQNGNVQVRTPSNASFLELFGTGGASTGLQFDGGTSGHMTFKVPATVTTYGVILPAAQGTGALTNDGAGNLSWASSGSGANTALSNLTSPTAVNQSLGDSSGVTSADLTARALFTTSGSIVTVRWHEQVLQLLDFNQVPSVAWGGTSGPSRTLIDSSNATSVDWNNKLLYEGADVSIDWADRLLRSGTGTNMFGWATAGTLSFGSNIITNPAGGTGTVAAAASTATITDSRITATSMVIVVITTADATAGAVRSVVPSSGSAALTLSAAATATTSFYYMIVETPS